MTSQTRLPRNPSDPRTTDADNPGVGGLLDN